MSIDKQIERLERHIADLECKNEKLAKDENKWDEYADNCASIMEYRGRIQLIQIERDYLLGEIAI